MNLYIRFIFKHSKIGFVAEEKISPYKIVIASVLYSMMVILIGYFLPEIEAYAAVIAALSAGVYAGYCFRSKAGMANGFLAGLIGGIATGVMSVSMKSIAGIPISISVAGVFQPIISSISPSPSLVSATALVVIGIFFGTLGGLVGSIRHLRPMFLLVTMFSLFIILGAIDNAAWNVNTPDWTWEMSFLHVLHNRLDIAVAAVFAVFVTIMTYVMDMFRRYER